MNLKDMAVSFTNYNVWADKKMVAWLQQLDANVLYHEATSSYASIDLTIQHMIHAQNFWFAVLNENDFLHLDETIKMNQAENNMHELITGAEKMHILCNAYTEKEILHTVSTDVTSQSRYQFILHYVNHNTYHRGQIVTISRGLGVKENIPLTDYEYFLWNKE